YLNTILSSIYSFFIFFCLFFYLCFFFFFFNDTATTEIYTLSLHDALPICYSFNLDGSMIFLAVSSMFITQAAEASTGLRFNFGRSEEHTSELQSLAYLVCRLLLEKKKKKKKYKKII